MWNSQMLISYIQQSLLVVSCQLSKPLSRTAGWFGVKSVCSSSFFSFSWDILGWAAFIHGFHFSLEAGDWLSCPSSSVPRCYEMELLSRSLKVFIVATSCYFRSGITWNGWKFSKTTGKWQCGKWGVWVDGVANINMEKWLFLLYFSELNPFFWGEDSFLKNWQHTN